MARNGQTSAVVSPVTMTSFEQKLSVKPGT